MNSLKLILLTATFMLAMAFTFSCSSGGGGGDNNGNAKSDCIKSELQIKANTLDNVAAACDAIRSEVLSQLSDNVGNCNKNDLSFDKPIGNILSECGESEVPVVGGSSSSGGNGGGGRSSSGGSGSGVDMSGVSMQVYLDDVEYTGNGDIIFVYNDISMCDAGGICEYFGTTLPAGKIQNGKITLNLPESIDNKYLDMWEQREGFSSPNDLYFFDGVTSAVINGKKCYLDLIEETEVGVIMAAFIYLSKSGEIKGTGEIKASDNDTMDVSFSKGWNIFWMTYDGNSLLYSTNRPQTINKLKWQISTSDCRDD